MSEAPTPETGALSVEQAIASLAPEPVEDTAAEAPVEAAAEPAEPEGETSTPDVAEDGAETPAEDTPEAEVEAVAVAPVNPPRYWSQDAKAEFAKLPPDLQAVVLAQEGPREEATAKVKAEAAEQIAAASKEIESVKTLAEQLQSFLPEVVQAHQRRWGAQEPDWTAVTEQYGAEEAFKFKTQFDKEQKDIAQLADATRKAQTEAHRAFVQAEWKALAEIAPDLAPDAADPTKGTDKRQAVVKYLAANGIPEGAIAQISAREMSMAHKAMLWDQAQAALKAAPRPKPAAPAATSPVRPAAAPAPSSTQRTAATVANRFAQTRSVDDAVAVLLARKG